MSDKIVLKTPTGVLSYPKVFDAELPHDAKPGDLPKWSTTILFTEEALKTPEWKAMVDAVMTKAREELGAKPDAKVSFAEDGKSSMLVDGGKKSARMPFRKNATGKYGDEIVMYINVNKTSKGNSRAPEVIDRRAKLIEVHDEIYPGVLARLALSCFAYKRADGWGVSFGLNAVQKVKDGPRIDNYTSASDVFGALDAEDGAGDDDMGGLLG